MPAVTEPEGEPVNNATVATTAASALPVYSAGGILPNGGREPAPLAPGMLVSIYGEHLGPEPACTGSADPQRQETPNPHRPNQTLVEIQVFPKRLCDTEVRVGGIAAGLLYVHARQINFKVPQELPLEGAVEVRVSHKGRAGPAVRVKLGDGPNTESAERLAATMWSGLQGVEWETPYRAPGSESGTPCRAVPEHKDLRGGLYGYAYHCLQTMTDVVGESFYYPVNPEHPAVLLRRADLRLAAAY
ncbi:MAG: hypothetical protein GY953_03075, partial [bacterium]|nr:hypothetical protein [bacterium]